jgi:hypothetical protein
MVWVSLNLSDFAPDFLSGTWSAAARYGHSHVVLGDWLLARSNTVVSTSGFAILGSAFELLGDIGRLDPGKQGCALSNHDIRIWTTAQIFGHAILNLLVKIFTCLQFI